MIGKIDFPRDGPYRVDYQDDRVLRVRVRPKGVIIEGDRVMPRTTVIKEQAGEQAHPFFFWLGFIALAYVDLLLYHALYQGFALPSAGVRLSASLLFGPEDFLPLFALIVFGLQCKLNTWRPAGWWGGFFDLVITLVPIMIIGSWVASNSGMLAPFVALPPTTTTHYALMAAVWFGVGAAFDLVRNFFKRSVAVANSSADRDDLSIDGIQVVETMPQVMGGYSVTIYGRPGFRIDPERALVPYGPAPAPRLVA